MAMTTPPQDSWITPKARIRISPISGKGLFAREDISKGEMVSVWGGTYVTREEAEKEKARGRHVMQWDDDLFSVEDRGDDDTYFINHSCDGNLGMMDAYTLVALRDVAAGEELTADYAIWEANPDYVAIWDCICGATVCRKKITGHDWERPDVQVRYRGYFAPFVQKRINSRT